MLFDIKQQSFCAAYVLQVKSTALMSGPDNRVHCKFTTKDEFVFDGFTCNGVLTLCYGKIQIVSKYT
jgi:hypothetical protein